MTDLLVGCEPKAYRQVNNQCPRLFILLGFIVTTVSFLLLFSA